MEQGYKAGIFISSMDLRKQSELWLDLNQFCKDSEQNITNCFVCSLQKLSIFISFLNVVYMCHTEVPHYSAVKIIKSSKKDKYDKKKMTKQKTMQLVFD